jgi:hypothetical protein
MANGKRWQVRIRDLRWESPVGFISESQRLREQKRWGWFKILVLGLWWCLVALVALVLRILG